MQAELMSLPEKIAVAEFWPNPSFDARLVALGLESAAAAIGRAMTAVPISCRVLSRLEDAAATPFELARRFDSDEQLRKLAEQLRRDLPGGIEAVLLPPWLGMSRLDAAPALSALVGMPCCEALSGSPSVPGLRLQNELDRALQAAGVRRVEMEVEGVRTEGAGGFTSAVGEARAIVLATGKFIGGGIVRKDGRSREPVFGLPVSTGTRWVDAEYAGSLLGSELFQPQELFSAGVLTDGDLRPLDRDGKPFSDGLFAAGAILAGHDPAADKTGLGLAIFTGYLAGELACENMLRCRIGDKG
jgi:glycerol-3-phosphate dehydrogenase subunit B